MKANQFDHLFTNIFGVLLRSALRCSAQSYYCEVWGISRQNPCLSPSSHWIMIELFKMKCAIPVQILQTLFLWEICTPNHILRFGLNKQSQDISDGPTVIQSLRKLAKIFIDIIMSVMWPLLCVAMLSLTAAWHLSGRGPMSVICVTRTKFIIWPHGASTIDHHASRIWQDTQNYR